MLFHLLFFLDEFFAKLVELAIFVATVLQENVELLSLELIVLFYPDMILL